MEKLLTTTTKDLARFRKDAPEEAVSEEERNTREAYHYTKVSPILPLFTYFVKRRAKLTEKRLRNDRDPPS